MRAVVVGGGFYGCSLAIYLKSERGFDEVILLEAGPELMGRASYANQARVHGGYHYPRSFRTAYRSRVNLPRFAADWPDAVWTDVEAVYAIAREGSLVTGSQFTSFCRNIGAPLEAAPKDVSDLFERRAISEVFSVREYVFGAAQLREILSAQLAHHAVDIRLSTRAQDVRQEGDLVLVGAVDENKVQTLRADLLLNCTYARLNHLVEREPSGAALKHEITEMPLVTLPEPLARLGLTVMDGPFFSLMPFPSRGCHTLSHVRYTPHTSWLDRPEIDPYEVLRSYNGASRFSRMRRDVMRYLPLIEDVETVGSLYEVKTVLTINEGNDGRPILVHRYPQMPRVISILGGKIDNIYDVVERLDSAKFMT